MYIYTCIYMYMNMPVCGQCAVGCREQTVQGVVAGRPPDSSLGLELLEALVDLS